MDIGNLSAATMVDIVIALTALEALVLWIYHRRTGRGIAGKDLSMTLLSGVLLMLALRATLAGYRWEIAASLLAGGGVCHGLDLWRRWQPPARPGDGIRPS